VSQDGNRTLFQNVVTRLYSTPERQARLRVCNPSTGSGGGFSLLRFRPEAVYRSLGTTTPHASAMTPLFTTTLDRTVPGCTKPNKGTARNWFHTWLSPHSGHREPLHSPTPVVQGEALHTPGSEAQPRQYGLGGDRTHKGVTGIRTRVACLGIEPCKFIVCYRLAAVQRLVSSRIQEAAPR